MPGSPTPCVAWGRPAGADNSTLGLGLAPQAVGAVVVGVLDADAEQRPDVLVSQAVVDGPTFAIEIADDWTLESRFLDGTLLPFDDLSVGAKEQLGILTRLAAAQIVAEQGGVPLIIDDALGFSDPTRLDTMGAAISAAGKHCQIVILTCTPGRFSNVGSATTVQF